MTSVTIPAATYRLQFHAGFTFADATAITDYLDALGVSHCYASSYLAAVPGSPHGYDVVDPSRLNPEIGDEHTHGLWVASLQARGMGHILDLVPNHMGIALGSNPWWQDVLENGPSSEHAAVFDIDWHPLKTELQHKVLLPVLRGPYGEVLERQEIRLSYRDGAFEVRHADTSFPVAPDTYDRILDIDAATLVSEVGADDPVCAEFLSLLTAIRHLPRPDEGDPGLHAERHREKEIVKRRLAALTRDSSAVRAHVERAVAAVNGVAGDPSTFDRLDALLAAQPYRLAYWRVAGEEINYRRFFDINELAAIRMEDPAVFERTHRYPFDLLERGLLDGFRIDHVDGLYDPADYLRRLRQRADGSRQPYIVVEKILAAEEPLPDWPIAGTTGYDFLGRVNGLFVDARNERAMTDIYERFVRTRASFRELAYQGKQLVLRVSMASELGVLAHRLNQFSERNRHYRDFTLNSLTLAIREIIASFPVYRTYVTEREPEVSGRDRGYIDAAVREATRRNPRRPAVVFDFVRDLLLRRAPFIPAAEDGEYLTFVRKFQQVTSPVTARGIEDTAFYIYNRLASLNEVGSEPDRFGTSEDDLHAWFRERAERWPHSLSATSTHDTKRGEDVRARLNVLSEIPGAWKQAASQWARHNRRGRTLIDGQSYPSRNEEYFLYQTLVGTWPPGVPSAAEEAEYRARITSYMIKAMREAKVFSSWLTPSELHEQAMTRFIEVVLAPGNDVFRADFLALQRRVAQAGLYNSLAQVVIKIGAPGVPDFYQGTEVWDFSLVDPDNRRPVDYAGRRSLLLTLEAERARKTPEQLVSDLLAQPEDPRLKLFTTMTALAFRRAHAPLFQSGSYEGLDAEGGRRDHVFAFRRRHGAQQAVVCVPRLVGTLRADLEGPPIGERTWGDTRILLRGPAPPCYQDIFTGRCVSVDRQGDVLFVRAADVFRSFPVAILQGT